MCFLIYHCMKSCARNSQFFIKYKIYNFYLEYNFSLNTIVCKIRITF